MTEDMTFEEKAQLFRLDDCSPEAIARRLKAARMLVTAHQKEFAALLDLSDKTYHSQEKRGAPSMKVMSFLYKNARVGPNFILLGEFVPLPGDVQDALANALREND